jgi:hypothetical protein
MFKYLTVVVAIVPYKPATAKSLPLHGTAR